MTDGTVAKPKNPLRSRRCWFRIITAILVWGTCELLSLVGLQLAAKGWPEVAHKRDVLAVPQSEREEFSPVNEVIHPYLGWVQRPRSASPPLQPLPVSDFGFFDEASPLTKRDPESFVVAVVGGSLAEEFSQVGWPLLKARLEAAPLFQRKRLKIVRLALRGYKQPQQLLLINFLMSLGAEFDVVVNIDGFNELALPEVENVPHHVFAAFPRNWQTHVTDAKDIRLLRQMGYLASLRDIEQRRAAAFSKVPWRWSPTATLVWLAFERRSQANELEVWKVLNSFEQTNVRRVELGPPQKFESSEQLHQHCAEIWKHSSQLLHNTCQQRGTRYLHFLQPNQYVPDSKPQMSEAERSRVIRWDFYGRRPVEEGYRLLQRAGEELRASGVEFADLTQIFRDETAVTYRDECCHLSDHGNEILAQRIAEVLLLPR